MIRVINQSFVPNKNLSANSESVVLQQVFPNKLSAQMNFQPKGLLRQALLIGLRGATEYSTIVG